MLGRCWRYKTCSKTPMSTQFIQHSFVKKSSLYGFDHEPGEHQA